MKKLAILGECMIELNGEPFGEMHQTYGGDSLNTATYLARVSSPEQIEVRYLSALGTDKLSQGMLAAWQADNINTDFVLRDEYRQPGLYLIQLDKQGERTFLYWRNQSAARYLLQHPDYSKALSALHEV
ncbi:TPA: PfkB family carbohydrate kinase, partial [Mannheimia haemolytica]